GELARLLVVVRHVRDEVADDGECPKWSDRHGLVLLEGGHPRHARQARHAVHLHRARAALAGLAVPPAREVGLLCGLQAVDDVEDDLALVDLHLVVADLSARGVAAPNTELTNAHDAGNSSSVMYLASSDRSKRSSRSGRRVGTGLWLRVTLPFPSTAQTRFILRHLGSIFGKSSRVCPPRDSSRSSAAIAVHSETTSILRRSRAKCQPGL